MTGIQSSSETTLRSVTTSVLKMKLDQAKQDGVTQQTLIEGAASIQNAPPSGANPPGVGTLIDVHG